MSFSHYADVPAEVRARASRVRLLALDVDGVLTDGRLGYGADGETVKFFNVLDGQGLKLLLARGIDVAWISARASAPVAARAAELGIRRVHLGERNKRARLDAVVADLGIGLDEVAYVGDDLPDLGCLVAVGLSIAPANAHPWIKERVRWRTLRAGGDGAVRDVCDLILGAQGHAEALIADALGEPPR